MRFLLRSWFRALLLVGTVTLVGCSSTTFVYNRMDFLLPWYVDDYTDLNGDQKDYLDERLEPFLAWHRSQELPRYVTVLEHMEASLDQPATAEGVEELALEFEQAWLRLEDESLAWLLDLGEQLDDEQVQEFMDTLWKQQREYEKKYLERTDEEFVEDSYDNMLDSARDYLGRLDKEQKALLKTASENLERSDSAWLAERAAWLEELGVLMQREPGWQQRVREAVAVRPDNLSEDYERIYAHNAGVLYAMMADLVNSRSERQDRHLRETIADLRADLETLIAQGEAGAKPASAG